MAKIKIPGSLRWAALIIASIAMFGNYFLYDSVAYVGGKFIVELNFSQQNIGQLYSKYSIAAAIVLLFNGILIDKYGA